MNGLNKNETADWPESGRAAGWTGGRVAGRPKFGPLKHENDMKYPLFYLAGRARGLGSSPVMELGQTPFMALALKVGSFDTDKWTPEQQKKLSDELKKEAEERAAKRMEED